MATGYEVKFYRDVERIANSLERIATELEKLVDLAQETEEEG